MKKGFRFMVTFIVLLVSVSMRVWVFGERFNHSAVAPAIFIFIALVAIHLGLSAILEYLPALRRNTKLKTILQDEVLGFGYTMGLALSLSGLLLAGGIIHVFREVMVVAVTMTSAMLVVGLWPRSKGFWNC